jgi:hypothetical protein
MFKVGDKVGNKYGAKGKVVQIFTQAQRERAYVLYDNGAYGSHLLTELIAYAPPPTIQVYAVCDENNKVLAIGDTEKEAWNNYSDMPNFITPKDCGYSIRPATLTLTEMK